LPPEEEPKRPSASVQEDVCQNGELLVVGGRVDETWLDVSLLYHLQQVVTAV